MNLEVDEGRNTVSIIAWSVDYLKMKYGLDWALHDYHIHTHIYAICMLYMLYICIYV